MIPRYIFFGTPFFAAELLRFLCDQGLPPLALVTQPDRPKGRSLQLTPSPAKEVGEGRGIPILQPEKASEEPFLEQLRTLKADLFLVVAYGQILSQRLLDIPPLGCVNLHASLLPKYRGAAPIQRCLMAGERETGVVLQKMVRRLDAGAVLKVAKCNVPEEITFGELERQLLELSKPIVAEFLKGCQGNFPAAVEQEESLATYAAKIEAADTEIDWKRGARGVHDQIRALSPRPGAWCWIEVGGERRRMKILKSRVVREGNFSSDRGKIFVSGEGRVSTGEGEVEWLKIQPEGKREMGFSEWVRGVKGEICVVL